MIVDQIMINSHEIRLFIYSPLIPSLFPSRSYLLRLQYRCGHVLKFLKEFPTTINHFCLYLLTVSLAATRENVPLDMCAQRRFRSDCAFAQSDLNLLAGRILDRQGRKDSSCRQRRLCSYCADAQANFSLRWEHISDGTFSHVAALTSHKAT